MKKELLKLLSNGYWEPDMCPVCGGDVSVTQSNANKKGTVGRRRRKQCLECNYVFFTLELLIDPIEITG